MNIGPDIYEKAIAASCIQLAQAYSVTDSITINDAKLKVGRYLNSLLQFKIEEQPKENPTEDFKAIVSAAIKRVNGKQDKAYFELLKLRESLN